MAVAVVLSLVGPTEPRAVQVAVTGLSGGEVVTVAGSAAGHSWSVRGGRSVTVSGSVLRLVDVATPINAPVTYTVTVDGVEHVEGPITVPYTPPAGESPTGVLQSLDGRVVVPIARWLRNDDPRDLHLRSVALAVPGRDTVVGRWDVAAGESGVMDVRLSPASSAALERHLRTVGPVLLVRTHGSVRDLPAVQYVMLTAVPRELSRVHGHYSDRVWSLRFELIDDPEPDTIVPISTWDDFDAAFADLTWDDFDAEMAGMTWDDFDALDWTQYA